MEAIMSATDKTDLAVWRYGLISSFLHRNEDGETLEEAYERQEKTITAETLYSSSWFNESE